MDMENMRPAKPTAKMLEAYVMEEKLPMDYAPRKIALPAEGGIRRETIEIRRHHLDTNYHVNNGQYIRIAMECLPAGLLQKENAHIRQMRAEYKKQAHLGDRIYPVVYSEGEETAAIALNNQEGQPYCVVELKQQC